MSAQESTSSPAALPVTPPARLPYDVLARPVRRCRIVNGVLDGHDLDFTQAFPSGVRTRWHCQVLEDGQVRAAEQLLAARRRSTASTEQVGAWGQGRRIFPCNIRREGVHSPCNIRREGGYPLVT